MSASLRLRVGLVAAGLCCWLLSSAAAQQGQSSGQSSSSRSGASSASGQSDRSSGQQSGRSSARSGERTYGESAQRHTANYGSAARGAAGGPNSEVEQFMVNCLLVENEGEVRLAQFAQEQAQSSEVKDFARTMARDHQQLVQQLQQLASTQGGTASGASSSSAGRSGASGTSGAFDRSGTNSSDTSGTSGTDTSGTGIPGSSGASGTTARSGQSSASSQSTDLTAGIAGQTGGSGAIQQLIQLDRQIAERKMQMTKEDLQQRQGAEFDKAFVGMTIPAHVHMVAQLEVLEQQGGQLGQLAKQARPITQSHLDHAKQLIQSLASESGGSSNQAERSRSRTQR